MAYDYYEACDIIETGEPYSMGDVADTWRNFAEAARNAAAHTQGTADAVTAQYGEPYQAFGERAAPVASWLKGIGTQADTVAGGLSSASDVGSSAQIEMYQQRYAVREAWDNAVVHDDALSPTLAAAASRRTQQAGTVLSGELDKWSAAYDAFQPGAVAPAPTNATSSGPVGTTSAGTSTGSNPTVGPLGSTTSGAAQGTGGTDQAQLVGTPVTSPTGMDFPNSSVVGQDGGDFAGWVRDPRTGFLIDPSTGREFDPTSGRWIDPVTGLPFGDVVQQATRLEGLDGGQGLLNPTNPGPVSPLLSGNTGQTGPNSLFGPFVPPSLAQSNPAASQLRNTAQSNMHAKAFAAEQLAMKEAAQGGRPYPYLPPMQGGGGGQTGPRGGGARRTAVRGMGEPQATWAGRGRTGRTSGIQGGLQDGQGRNPYLPPTQAGGGRSERGRQVRGGQRLTEPESTWAGRSRTARPGRPAGVPGEQARPGPYLPPTSGAGGKEEDRKRRKSGIGGEDDVWSATLKATPPVLGE